MEYSLAIDIGASSGRHVIGYIKDGKMITQEIYRFPNAPVEKDGKLIWDTERLFSEIVNGLKKAKEIDKIPTTIGIDTWGVDYALLDSNDNLIGEVYCYRDARNEKSYKKVHDIVAFEEVYKRTGIEFAQFNTIYQLYDDFLTGKLDNAQTFLQLPDYFHFLLTGVKKQEYTNATTTALVNANTHDWDFELIEKLGIKTSLFNSLNQPATIVGELKGDIRKVVGYNAKVVMPATHDTASAVLSVPSEKEYSPYISSGTWSLMGVEVPKAITNAQFEGKPFSNEGSVDFNFRFQTNIMGMWIFQNVKKEIGEGKSFTELTALAKLSDFNQTFDVNDKSFFAPKSMVDAIKDYYVNNGKTPPVEIGDICRAIFISLAESYAKTIKAISTITNKSFNVLHIIGGGSQNQLLNELTAKATGLKVIAGPTEATAIGNLLVQSLSLGSIPSLSKGKEIIKNSFDITEIENV